MHGQLVHTAADVRLLTEMPEAGHGNQHSLCVRAPQEGVETHLQLGLSLFADGDETALCGTLLQTNRANNELISSGWTIFTEFRMNYSFFFRQISVSNFD